MGEQTRDLSGLRLYLTEIQTVSGDDLARVTDKDISDVLGSKFWQWISQPYAERIVSCVNAMQGIPDPQALMNAVATLVEVGGNAAAFTDDVHMYIEKGDYLRAVGYLNEIRTQLNDAIAAVRAAG